MSLQDKLQADQKSEYASSGNGYFKFKEGDNQIRVLADPIAIYKDFKLGMCYTDCKFKGSIKYLSYVLDRSDNNVKLMEIPFGIMETVASYEQDVDYGFSGFPMPYDIKINAKGAGTKEVTYTVIPKPKSEVAGNLTEGKKSLDEIITAMKNNNLQKHQQDGTWDRLHTDGEVEITEEAGGEGQEQASEKAPF